MRAVRPGERPVREPRARERAERIGEQILVGEAIGAAGAVERFLQESRHGADQRAVDNRVIRVAREPAAEHAERRGHREVFEFVGAGPAIVSLEAKAAMRTLAIEAGISGSARHDEQCEANAPFPVMCHGRDPPKVIVYDASFRLRAAPFSPMRTLFQYM